MALIEKPRPTSWRSCLIVPLLAWAVAGPAAAALWYESYDQAEQAIQNENWPEAVRLLTEALEAKSESSARARTYGMNFITYFPYYKLGIAYYRIGQAEAALQAFDTEEGLGAIVNSAADFAELQRIRELIQQEQEAAAAQEQQRIAGIVTDSLTKARQLEDAGQLDDALNELANALAIAQDNPEAKAARQRLLDKIARQQQERDLESRVASLVGQGRGELSAKRYGEAASFFQRALDLKPSAEVRGLRDEAQNKLRAQVEADQTAQQRTATIARGLQEAGTLEAEGKLAQALDRLQTVLALDPRNRRALEGQDRLIRAQAKADQESSQQRAVETLLAEARKHIDAADYPQALSTANRALAIDPENSAAKAHISTAISNISRTLLSSVGNDPPVLSVDDSREQLPGYETPAQLLRKSVFIFSGIVVDESAVKVAFFDGSGNEVRTDPGDLKVSGQLMQGLYVTTFNLLRSVPAGLSELTVVATDEHGADNRLSYAVVYDRPWHRSPWLYTAIVVIALGLVGAQVGRRIRIRIQRLKRRFNPYIAGAPVMQEEFFFGRERLINHVLERIHNNSILLYGERRIGKTSIQHRLRTRLRELQDPKYQFYAAYIDLQGTPEERFFPTMADDLFHELAPLLDGLTPSASTSDEAYDHRAFQKDIRAIIRALKKKTDKQVKLVLLIDEVDELNNYDPRINQRLRSLFMKSFAENLVAVVSGVGIKKQWELEGSPWYNFFQEIEVQPFQRKDAVELIEGPIRGVFKLEDGVIDNIIEVTNCKPYLIQRVCAAAVNRVHDDKRRRITIADVRAVAQVAEVM